MNPDKSLYIRNWLIKANEDIAVVIELSRHHPENYTSAISFHSQQAVEKFLKAFLIYNDKEFHKTHDIDYLLMECMDINRVKFGDIDLKNLNDYAVTVRYPDDFIIPELEEANENKSIALKVKQIVEEMIKF